MVATTRKAHRLVPADRAYPELQPLGSPHSRPCVRTLSDLWSSSRCHAMYGEYPRDAQPMSLRPADSSMASLLGMTYLLCFASHSDASSPIPPPKLYRVEPCGIQLRALCLGRNSSAYSATAALLRQQQDQLYGCLRARPSARGQVACAFCPTSRWLILKASRSTTTRQRRRR